MSTQPVLFTLIINHHSILFHNELYHLKAQSTPLTYSWRQITNLPMSSLVFVVISMKVDLKIKGSSTGIYAEEIQLNIIKRWNLIQTILRLSSLPNRF